MCLVPPYNAERYHEGVRKPEIDNLGYYLIFASPSKYDINRFSGSAVIDFSRLGLQIAATVIAGAASIYLLHKQT
jgi:hypothetical protein